MFGRPAKRARTSRTSIPGTSYHNPVPLPSHDNFSTVHYTEGRVWRTGGGARTAPAERTAHEVSGTWEGLQTWTTPDNDEYALDPNGDWYDEALEQDVVSTEVPIKMKKAKSRVSRRPNVVWMETHRQTYLDEMLRWAGRGDFRTAQGCPDCLAQGTTTNTGGSPEYRCRECFLPDLTCQACCVRRHRRLPFHRIEKWTGSNFVKISLQSLGLKLQLNHAGMFCENPIPCHSNLVLLHINGVHSISIQYCGCTRAIPIHLQLLRRGLYPATQLSIKTVATFDLLRHLHKLALTTKASTYDFYRCLEKSTENLGVNVPKNRYRSLFRMVLQWRHLQMLKWAGRGHDAGGVAGTLPGQLAVPCPSCPHPGINLPDVWRDAPEEMRFLYMVIICMDANFRLKNQLVSNYSQDPGLGTGWAYMVPRKPYENYVLSRANDEDISTCVGFQALAKANTKFLVGLRYTGVNLTVCGRSEMIFPLGVGNLQKGERYANMDYIFGSTLQFVSALLVLISYDICCQWFINLFKRMDAHWPDHIKPRPGVKLVPAIPKLHEPMHEQNGHQVYSLNFIPGVGLSDCECPERVWSPHNYLANGTKTQGPGSRQDVLDDHFGFWNWSKYINQGRTLLRRYKSAVADRNRQVEGHRGLTESIDKKVVKAWERMCVEWERDTFPKTKKNPYHAEGISLSEAQVRKELDDEDEVFRKQGGRFLHATTASAFICLGLDLEDAQRRLRRKVQSVGSTPKSGKEGSLNEERKGLFATLRAWESLVAIYVPGLLQYQADHPAESPTSSNPEDAILWLPSRIPQPHRTTVCTPGLADIEERMRGAQCSDALDAMRKILTVKSRMVKFKNKNLRGQRDGTRSRAVIDRVHERARLAAEKYRAARKAKLALSGPGDWEERFKVLQDADIRGFQDPERLRPRTGRKGIWEDGHEPVETTPVEDPPQLQLFHEPRNRRDGTGETRRTLSWIWTSSPAKSSKPSDGGKGGGTGLDGEVMDNEDGLDKDNGEEQDNDSDDDQDKEDDNTDSDQDDPDNQHEDSGVERQDDKHERSAANVRRRKKKKSSDDDEVFRVEWAKSRARANRGKEEVMLLKEEMRRVLAFLGWKANWWKKQVGARGEVSKGLDEGIAAYALSQAANQESLANHFCQLWHSPLQEPQGTTGPNDHNEDSDSDSSDGNDDNNENDDELDFDPDDMEE